MKVKAILIPQDAREKATKVEYDRDDLRAMQRFVGGHLGVTDIHEIEASVWYNEEGKLLEEPVVNYRATFLLWVHKLEYAYAADYLVGDILVTGLPDDGGDTKSVPDELVFLLFGVAQYHVVWNFIGQTTKNRQTVTFVDPWSAFDYAYQLARRNHNIENVRVVPA